MIMLSALPADCSSNLNAGHRIVGGTDAKATGVDFSYQVSLQICGQLNCIHICGGTIVSPKSVVTAGHCIFSDPKLYIRVVAGIVDLRIQDKKRQERNVTSYSVHPTFDQKSK